MRVALYRTEAKNSLMLRFSSPIFYFPFPSILELTTDHLCSFAAEVLQFLLAAKEISPKEWVAWYDTALQDTHLNTVPAHASKVNFAALVLSILMHLSEIGKWIKGSLRCWQPGVECVWDYTWSRCRGYNCVQLPLPQLQQKSTSTLGRLQRNHFSQLVPIVIASQSFYELRCWKEALT